MELNKTLQEIHAEATAHGVKTVFIPADDFTRYQGKSRTHCGHDDTGDMITFNDVVIRPCDGPPYVEKPKALSGAAQLAAVPIHGQIGYLGANRESEKKPEPVPVPAEDDLGEYRTNPLNDDFAHERSRRREAIERLDSSRDDRKPEPHTAHQPKVEHRGKKK